MALIKCPECGREISDKAECCPGCGCPASEWTNKEDKKEKQEQEKKEPERHLINGKYGMVIAKDNGRFVVWENDSIKCECPDSTPYISNIIRERREEIYSFWTPGLNPVIRFIPENEEEKRIFHQLFFDEIQKYLTGNKKIKNPEPPIQKAETSNSYVEKNEQNISLYALRCPSCRSINLQIVTQEVRGARGAKTKTTTSLNLNPFKPFTLLNHKERVLKKAVAGSVYVKWRCVDCGFMFERKES